MICRFFVNDKDQLEFSCFDDIYLQTVCIKKVVPPFNISTDGYDYEIKRLNNRWLIHVVRYTVKAPSLKRASTWNIPAGKIIYVDLI